MSHIPRYETVILPFPEALVQSIKQNIIADQQKGLLPNWMLTRGEMREIEQDTRQTLVMYGENYYPCIEGHKLIKVNKES